VGVAREREERYGKKHRMVGVDTIGGRPKVGGCVSILVQWVVVASPKAEVWTGRERSLCGFWVNNLEGVC
jgi:hypothetical protein